MFTRLDKTKSFPEREKEVLAFWRREKIFEKSLERRKTAKPYVFFDGPPFATGLPHYGHLLPGTVKDVIPRYWTMRGRYVERRFGWDCHGLPIEKLAQDELGLKGTPEILKRGVDVFNEQCRSMVLKYVDAWRSTVERSGRWVDFDNNYKTMDRTFMESVWWVFKQIWDQGRIYRAHRVMPYSWALTTPLSNFEANSNYKDVQDPSITVRFQLAGRDREYLLCWTTTPWTLPANLGICAGPDVDYVKIRDGKDQAVYYMAEARLAAYYKKPEDYAVLERLKGAALAGLQYQPLFPYFRDHPGAFRVLLDGFVTTADGTGLVHMAPAYGEDDYRICKAAGIALVDPLDAEARFTDAVPDFQGQQCKDADKGIIRRLKDEGKLVHQSTIVHSYPFCDRSDTPLIYRAINAWYIKVEDIRDRLARNNERIRWVPDYVGAKRFGNWLREAKDWNFSRNRFWGSCIPIWECPDCGQLHCVGSIAELQERSGQKITDLHKHFLDPVTFPCTKPGCGGALRRIPEVFDCWFESGAMPYGQSHYPFENRAAFEAAFPADFIAESLDQTRGWFYTLLVLSTLLFDQPAMQNVIVSGLILAEDGKKMSKRLKNYPAPEYVMETHGADALRLYLINSPVVRAEEMKFSEAGIKEILKSVIIPFWNAYHFLVEYAITDGWTPEPGLVQSRHELDRWILSRLQTLVRRVNQEMERYRLFAVTPALVEFIDELTNWYIRRSRDRFWSSAAENPQEKKEAYSTLYTVLTRFIRVLAPFLPFVSEEIYQNLKAAGDPASVHLTDFPQAEEGLIDGALEERMALVREVVHLASSLRQKHERKVRQPLRQLTVVTADPGRRRVIEECAWLIQEEINVKEVRVTAEEAGMVEYRPKANFKLLGKRLGGQMKAVAAEIAALSQAQAAEYLRAGSLSLPSGTYAGEEILVDRLERPGLQVETGGGITVALDTRLDRDLLLEGHAVEIKSQVNRLRREAGLDKEDRIHLVVQTPDPEIRQALAGSHGEYIRRETLAESLVETGEMEAQKPVEVNGKPVVIGIRKSRSRPGPSTRKLV